MPLRLGFNLWLDSPEGVALSIWRVALLQAVADTGSISAAAARMGVHFRVAWKKIREMEERLGVPLVVGRAGGTGGGGADLTPDGMDVVRRFRALETGLEAELERRAREHFASWLEGDADA